MPIYHNWQEIVKLDQRLRLALSLTPIRQISEPFLELFPECFTEEEQPLYIPLSALMKGAAKGQARETRGWKAEEKANFGLASAGYFHLHLALEPSRGWDGQIPEDVLQQLVGQRAQAGMLVKMDGEDHLVLHIAFEGGLPEIGSPIESPPKLSHLYLCPAKFVALDR